MRRDKVIVEVKEALQEAKNIADKYNHPAYDYPITFFPSLPETV